MAKEKSSTKPESPAESSGHGGGGKSGGEVNVFDHLELLSAMGRDFASSLDIEASLKRAIEHITNYVNAEGGALFMLDDEGETLRCHASVGPVEIIGLTLEADQGIVGRCVQSNASEFIRDVSKDKAFHGGVDEETGFTTRSILCAPMSVKDERIGAIELINKRGGDGLFADSDLHLLEAMSASAAMAIINARMAEALVEQERLARELELAAEIQRSLLPEPGGEDYPVVGVNHPARTVSGDFYDFFPLDDGRICFNLGDVSGKGMNAALLMAKTASLYRCLGKTVRTPGRLMARVNTEICETATRGMFVTLAGGIYDPKTGIIRLANAGHEPPLFHRPDGEFQDFPAEAPPVGITPILADGDEFPEIELHLDGGTLYIFTDGVTEGYLEDGSELEVEGFKTLIRDNAAQDTATRLDAVISLIKRGDTALRDDLTLLAIDDAKGHAARQAGESPEPVSVDIEAAAVEEELLLSLTVPSRADRLKTIRNAVTEAAKLCGLGKDPAHDVVLAVDEACQNIIRHAYGGSPNGKIKLKICRTEGELIILLRDFAETIDVSKVKPRELDDVKPGGLGTHFIREVMDETYFLDPPVDGGNLLRMIKRL
ncbi:MAG: SpoIIE family protein phosphatase [Rhodospirillales bacterium]|nr:SpoIIE family protein phosphatase [Alphaproteobacteria bacterium]MBL6947700.1 SpoIIE family protein phosphatase [Rhodospirillales bacterium]